MRNGPDFKLQMPRIDTTTGEHSRGIGDMVSLAWVAEGSRNTANHVSFYATGTNLTVLKLLEQDVTDQPIGNEIVLRNAYRNELNERGARLRLEYMREELGLETPFQRPRFAVPSEASAWASGIKQQFNSDLVLLFPQTLFEGRGWPPAYWIELAWFLKQRNVAPIILLASEDKRFANTPYRLWGFDMARVVALVALSKVVVANDSGPAHLAGTMGVPTFVTAGPTRPSCVFGHIPEVTALTSEDPPYCAGCHFGGRYRAACDEACQVLYALKPHSVLGRVIEKLARIAAERPALPIGLARPLQS